MTARATSLALGAVAARTLAACGGAEDEGTSGPDTTAEPTSDASPTETTTAAEESEEDDSQAFGACPEGRWELDMDVWADEMQRTMGADIDVVSVEGRVWITHEPDGTYTAEYEDWNSEFSTGNGTMYMERDGVDTGTWDDTGGTITVSQVSQDSQFDSYVETPEGDLPLPTGNQATDITGEFDYECQGEDTMVTFTDGIELDYTRD